MKQFLAWFTFTDGEHPTSTPVVFKARDMASAKNKAIEWTRTYFKVARSERERLKGDSGETTGHSFFGGEVELLFDTIKEANDAEVVASLLAQKE